MDAGRDGELYMATRDGLAVIHRLSAGSWRLSRVPGTGGPVHAVHVEADRTVWFGCGQGLCRLTPQGVEAYGPAEGVPPDRWAGIGSDPSGQLWVRCESGKVLTRPRGSRRFIDSRLRASGNPDLGTGPDGQVCIPSDTGLYYRTGSTWRLLTRKQGLVSDAVSACFMDREGSLWLGGYGSGLARWAGYGRWEGWTVAEGLRNDNVRAVVQDAAGDTWLGTDRGLLRLDQAGRIRLWTIADGLDADRITALAVGADGDIWISHAPGAITRVNVRRGQVERYGKAHGLDEPSVRSVAWDPADNTLWAGTPGGLYQGVPGRLGLRFQKVDPVPDSPIKAVGRIAVGREGRLWVAAAYGLAVRSRGAWRVLTIRDGLKRNPLADVVEGPGGSAWIAYYVNDGASRLEPAGEGYRITHFDRRSGLSSNAVVFTGIDRSGWVWLGTDKGVDVLRDGRWDHYDEADGLIWDDANSTAFLADGRGDVWIGTSRGLARFHHAPERARVPVPVRITAVYAGERLIPAAELSRIPYGDRSLLFSFTAVTFVSGKSTRFRYRMAALEPGMAGDHAARGALRRPARRRPHVRSPGARARR